MDVTKETQWYDSIRTSINEIGHSVADLNKICVGHLNEDFKLAYNLPFGKILSDMTGLCIGLNNFQLSNKSIFNNLSAAPINKKPPNPFTGNIDTDILLECINVIDSEEVHKESLYHFRNTTILFADEADLIMNSIYPEAQHFNSALEKVQTHYSNLPKPTKFYPGHRFGTNASRRVQQKPIDLSREKFLKAINEGFGLDQHRS